MEKEERWERESREENEQIRGMPRRRAQEISASLKSWGDRKRHTGNRGSERSERKELRC